MDKTTLMEKLKSGEISESTGNISNYVNATITVLKAEVLYKGEKDHPLLNSAEPNQPFIWLNIGIKTEDGKEKFHEEVANLLTRSGKLAVYPTSDDGEIAGTLLYDVIHGARENGIEVAQDWTKNLPSSLVGLTLKMRAKFISKNGGEYTILETSRQKKKDKEYEEAHNQIAASSPTIVDANDLPF